MYKKKISDYIDAHRDEMLEDIAALCRIDSTKQPYKEGMPYGAGCAQALNAALGMAEKYGFSVSNYDGYVGCADLNGGPKQLDILAHLDVVPAGDGWSVTDAFVPVIKDGKIYGRGTSDDKGPAVAALYAMRAVRELNIPVKKNVRLILGTDEECGSSDIAHYYDTEPEAPMTFSPDAEYPVVNVEKGRLAGHFTASYTPSRELPRLVSVHAGVKVNVVPGTAEAAVEGFDDDLIRGIAGKVTEQTGVAFEIQGFHNTLKICAAGRGAHASTPTEGNNALTALLLLLSRLPFADSGEVRLIRSLEQLFPHGDTSGKALGVAMADEISGDLTLAFSLLTVENGTLDGSFDSRCPICANEDNVLKAVKKRMKEQGFDLDNQGMKPPHYVSEDSGFVRTLLANYEKFTGLKGYCMAIGGGTYVHNLKNGVAFGPSLPGTDTKIHGADEFAVVEELLLSAKIFAHVIADLCE